MVNEIVWVYGSSAVGKETFIRYLVDNPSVSLIRRLDWQGKKLIVIWESVKYIAQYEDDPIGGKRKQIVEKVLGITDDNAVIIIKGQDIDIVSELPQLLKKKMPFCKHKIIFLYTDIEIVHERCKDKIWWKGNETTLEEFKGWLRHQIKLLSELEGFEIIAINNENKKYRQIAFPPKF